MPIPRSSTLIGVAAPRQEWVLLVLCIALSLALAFLPGAEGGRWGVQYLGYGHMLLLLGLAVWYLWRYAKAREPVYRRWWRLSGWQRLVLPAVLVLAASGFAHVHFPHRLKVLTDEASLAATSLAIQQHRIVYTPDSADSRNGVFVTGIGYINKRPYLYPVLVSLVNDLTGYRWNNGIVLNAALTPVVMLLFFLLGRRLWRRYGGALALLLASGVPIIAQTMTGGGLEVLNLALLLATTYCGLVLWARPSSPAFGLFVVAACLLGYARYESGLYLVPAGVLVLAALRRWRHGRIPLVLALVPILCVPLVWLQLVAFGQERSYFQMAAREDLSVFSFAYLSGNLRSAYDYFLVPSPVYLSAPLVFVLGCVGAFWLLAVLLKTRGVGRSAQARVAWVLVGMTAATLANAALFLTFNYGQYGEYITQRISIPVWGGLVLLVVWSAGRVRRGWWPVTLALAGGANLFWFHLPAAGSNHFESEYAYGKDFAFVTAFVASLDAPQSIQVVSHVPVFWLTQRCSAVGPVQATEACEALFRARRLAQCDRLLVHFFEYSPYYRMPSPMPARPPEWFAAVDKKLVARRWIGSGSWSVIYEVFPPAQGSVSPTAPPIVPP